MSQKREERSRRSIRHRKSKTSPWKSLRRVFREVGRKPVECGIIDSKDEEYLKKERVGDWVGGFKSPSES